jgi:tape measure domain-containing protein
MTGIKIELQLSDGSFTSGMLRAGQSMADFDKELRRLDPNFRKVMDTQGSYVKSLKRMETSNRTMLGTFRDISIVAGGLTLAFRALTGTGSGLIGSIVGINAEMERLKFMMEGMATSSDPIKEAGDNVAYLRDMATKVPFSLKEISTTFAKLKATGTDPMAGSMQALADGIAAFGGTDEQLHRVTLGISQMSGKSVIQMEEMRQQLSESMPTAMATMARSMGVSIAELTQAIATGRVQAKPALDAFYAELERTYGGTAQRMMQTFSGQVTQMRANFQQLATGPGLKGFVDGALKNAVRDLNEFLKSDQARKMADNLGAALSTVTENVVSLVKTFYEWREELLLIGKIAAGGMGLMMLVGTFNKLALAATNLKAAHVQMALGINEAKRSMRLLNTEANASALARGTFELKAMGGAALGLGRTLLAATPHLFLLGTAVIGAAAAFGNFKDKVKEAYEEVREFGAASREEADRISQEQQSKLEAQLKRIQDQLGAGSSSIGSINYLTPEKRAELVAAERALNLEILGVRGERAAILAKSGENEARVNLQALESKINEQEAEVTMSYRRRVDDQAKWLEAEQANMVESGRTQAQISEENAARTKANRLQEAEENEKIIADHYAREMNIAETATDKFVRAAARDKVVFLSKRLDVVREAVTAIKKEILGINMGPELESQEDKIKRGGKVLNSLTDDVAGLQAKIAGAGDEYAELMSKIERGDYGNLADLGPDALENIRLMKEMTLEKAKLEKQWKTGEAGRKTLEGLKDSIVDVRAELRGATGAVAKMQAQIDRGDYGSIEEGGDAVRALHDGLLAAAGQKEALDDMMKGQTKLEGDIERARMNAIEERLALEERALGRTMTEGERIQARFNAGYYEGLGPLSNILKSVEAVAGSIKVQGEAAEKTGEILRNDAFGTSTINQIDMTTSAVERLGAALMGVSGNLGSMKFDGLGNLVPNVSGMGAGEKTSMQNVVKMLMDEGLSQQVAAGIAGNFKVESNFNTAALGDKGTSFGMAQWRDPTPGKGRWTNLKNYAGSMGMDASNPLAQVKFTIDELNRDYPGLLGRMTMAKSAADAASMFMREFERPNMKYAHEDQRRQAATNAYELGGAGAATAMATTPSAPRSAVATARELAAWAAERAAAGVRYMEATAGVIEQEKANQSRGWELERKEWMEQTLADTQSASLATEDLGKHHQKLLEDIKTGRMGQNRDAGDAMYAGMIEAAKNLDKVEKDMAARKQAEKASETDLKKLKEDQVEIQRRLAEEVARTADPDYVGQSNELRRLNDDLNQYLDNVRIAYGEDTEQYRAALLMKQQALASHRGLEAQASMADAAKEARDLQDSLMTKTQLHKVQLDRRLADIDRQAKLYREAGRSEVEVTRWVEEQKALIREAHARETSPMAAQMAEWGDLQGTLAQKAADWTDSLATGVAGLITGTGDLRSAITGMINDVANMAVRYMFSQAKSGKTAQAGSAAKGGGTAKQAASKGMKAMGVPVAHTGGIIGSSRLSVRQASPGIFANAPKFHGGGIVGQGLLPSEQPVITKKGEGVFTPEQMAAMAPAGGGGQAISITAPITVNGGGGTQEQNADLAKQMAREMEQSMRTVVVTEISRQMRPGAMLSRS